MEKHGAHPLPPTPRFGSDNHRNYCAYLRHSWTTSSQFIKARRRHQNLHICMHFQAKFPAVVNFSCLYWKIPTLTNCTNCLIKTTQRRYLGIQPHRVSSRSLQSRSKGPGRGPLDPRRWGSWGALVPGRSSVDRPFGGRGWPPGNRRGQERALLWDRRSHSPLSQSRISESQNLGSEPSFLLTIVCTFWKDAWYS